MTINSSTYRSMLISAANALKNSKEKINDLNVFPVPDGDTGDNLALTMSGIARIGEYKTVGECAQESASAILRCARGNSGAILSLFFRGFAKAFKNMEAADAQSIALAFQYGAQEAYKAVSNPAEGTILTVMRMCAENAEEYSKSCNGDLSLLFTLIAKMAKKTTDKTPDMMPLLKQAKVVDAGGYGFTIAINGMLAALEGHPIECEETAETTSKAAFSDFNTDDIKFAYCTECIVEKSKKAKGEGSATPLREYLMGLGDSLVFIDDDEIIKIHVHTNEPGVVITRALEYGSLFTVKIENMRNQHSEIIEEVAATPVETVEEIDDSPEKDFGFVGVTMGEGIGNALRDLGVDRLVFGGQTMNPSTEDILAAISKVNAKTVFVLPNNKNIYLTAQQAANLTENKQVMVLESKTVAQGISAMMAFDECATAEENFNNMTEALATVTTISLTHAIRDSVSNNIEVKKDDCLAIVDGKIEAAERGFVASLNPIQDRFAEAVYVTIFTGDGADEKEAEQIKEFVASVSPEADIVVFDGGQPVYPYIISIE